jgi:cystatin-A/B
MRAITYATQVVAGLNYFIKVQIDPARDECLHLRVYKNLQQQLELVGIQKSRHLTDDLSYFDPLSSK